MNLTILSYSTRKGGFLDLITRNKSRDDAIKVFSKKMPTVSFSTLSLTGGIISCLCLAVMFVGALYLVPTNKPRDDPVTIRWRILATSLVSLVAPFYMLLWADTNSSEQGNELHHVLGIKLDGIIPATLYPLLLVSVLYCGVWIHTLMASLVKGAFKNSINVFTEFQIDISLRNYLIAPFVEEFVFRACMLPMLTASMGMTIGVLVCPLFFGVAHVHHLVEWYRWRRHSFTDALIVTTVQLCYTSLFGLYTAFLFVRTGHLISPVISHVYCNIMGLPDIDAIIRSKYSTALWVIYVLSLLSFFILLVPLTEPSLFHSIPNTSSV